MITPTKGKARRIPKGCLSCFFIEAINMTTSHTDDGLDFYEMITRFSDVEEQTTNDDPFNLQWDENTIPKSPLVDMPDNDDKLFKLLANGV